MGRQKIIHFNSNKQGQEFITAMAENALINELVIQHPASGESETALWTLESVNGEKVPVRFPNENTIQHMIDESTEGETERAISAETVLRQSIDSIIVVKVDSSELRPEEKEAYEVYVDGVAKGERISIYKNSSLYSVYLGHVDDTIVSENDPTVIDGTGDTALCFIYYTINSVYQLVTVDIEHFIEENEFKDGLQVVNHEVSVLINTASDEFLTVDSNGILLTGVTVKFNELDEKIELESLRALSAETILAEALDLEVERASEAETFLQEEIDEENERASEAETLLDEKIDDETERAISAETVLNNTIVTETERAQAVEVILSDAIETEVQRASDAEEELNSKIDNEIDRAQSAETFLREEIEAFNEKMEGIAIVRLPDTGYSSNERDVYELQIDGVKHGENIVVYKDSSLKYVYLGHVDDRLVSQDSSDIIQGTGDTALCFVYFTVDGIYQLVAVNVESFIEESEFGEGLEVINHEVKVKVDSTSEVKEGLEYLTVSENGLKIQGIQNTVSAMGETIESKCIVSAQTLNDAILEETVRATSAETVLNNVINAEEQRASEAEQAIIEKVDNESLRAQAVEVILSDAIETEAQRASDVERIINERIDNLIIDCGEF